MASVEETRLKRLESDLQVARMRHLRAEREFSLLERQAGFMDVPKRAQKELTRSERRLEKCEHTVADLLQQIDDLKNPKPEPAPEETAEGATDAEGAEAAETEQECEPSQALSDDGVARDSE